MGFTLGSSMRREYPLVTQESCSRNKTPTVGRTLDVTISKSDLAFGYVGTPGFYLLGTGFFAFNMRLTWAPRVARFFT